MKGKILQVGIVENGIPKGWVFDAGNIVPGLEIDFDGNQLICGYTIQELEDISNTEKLTEDTNI